MLVIQQHGHHVGTWPLHQEGNLERLLVLGKLALLLAIGNRLLASFVLDRKLNVCLDHVCEQLVS